METFPCQAVYEPPAMIEIGGFADHTLGASLGVPDGGSGSNAFFRVWW
ncbi:hypothetical protein Misp01_03610 [Microtetraspora sp. NBRC 13810]|nr:lasso RiPP family leader peptide-containing protein [Microtetraspora sp. NBRC 13810]GLW05231.1 hypothetical protein Misp01_03610 [Microtetraspora sp. NBRC 13810]